MKRASAGRRSLEAFGRRLAGKVLAHVNKRHLKPPIFIVGCHRSGTTMLLNVLRRSPQIEVCDEGDERAFGSGTRLLSQDTLRFLLYTCGRSRIAFKPLNDTHQIERLLRIHNDARAIWIIRSYRDVANSLVAKWGAAQREHVRQIATGVFSGPGSRALGEKVNSKDLAFVQKINSEDLSAHNAAAVIWLLRNSLYFDLNLDTSPQVLLVKYEDLCTDPVRYFQEIFDFLDCELSAAYCADVRSDSIGKHQSPDLDIEVVDVCEKLEYKFNNHYQQQLKCSRPGGPLT